MSGGIEVFERASEARARLLRAERLGTGLVLTFDVGRISVQAGTAGDLEIDHPQSREEIAGTLVSLEEEEPWWRLLGSPLTDAQWAGEGGRELRLRFREPTEEPRRIAIAARGGAVGARLASDA